MYSSIVVGTDGSQTAAKAIARARELAKGTACKVHVVSAAGKDPSVYGVPDAVVHSRDWVEEILADAGKLLDGVQFTTHACAGDAASALLDVAREEQADLILVGNRGMSRRVFGSVPNTVSHKAPCDVLIVSTS